MNPLDQLEPSSEQMPPLPVGEVSGSPFELDGIEENITPMLSDDEAIFDSNEQQEEDFYRNLAEELTPDERKKLAIQLLEDLQADEDSRADWLQSAELVYKNMGFTIEEFLKPGNDKICTVTDPTLAISWVIATSNLFGALFPPEGPCKAKILGKTTQQTEDKADRMKMWTNHYLVDIDEDFYPDANLMIGYLVLFGSAFTKTEPDPLTSLPISRFIKPQDLVVDINCSTILSSKRITHIERFSKKEIIQMERAGKIIKHYTKPLGEDPDENVLENAINEQEGLDKSGSRDKDRLLVYPQMYVELDSDDLPFLKRYDDDEESDDSMPKPYRVKISKSLSDVVEIRRNWEKGDNTYKRDECFTSSKYLEGFGLMGLGLIHLAGSVSLALTSIARQIIIATLYKNHPGGFMSKDMKSENNDVAIAVGEFRAIDCGEKTIQQCIAPLPFNGADPVAVQMYEKFERKVGEIAASAQTAIPENGGANTPAETTIAYLDVVNKVQSTVLQSNHSSLGNRLKIILKVFKRYFKEKASYQFNVGGQSSYISGEDFTDDVSIIPVSNPKILTTSHKIALAQMAMQLLDKAPKLYKERDVHKKMLLAVSMDDIDSILKPEPVPESSDPVTENMLILNNLPILANINQMHEAHIAIKSQFANEQKLLGNMAAYIAATQNVQIHKACKVLQEMAQKANEEYRQMMMTVPMDNNFIGHIQQQQAVKMQQFQNLMTMPSVNLLKIPEIQNIVAKQDLEQLQQQQQAQQQQQSSQVDPNHVMLLDVQQQSQANAMKHEEAMKKLEVEAFKSTQGFEGIQLKANADRDISHERNETQVELAKMKIKNEKLRGQNVKENF